MQYSHRRAGIDRTDKFRYDFSCLYTLLKLRNWPQDFFERLTISCQIKSLIFLKIFWIYPSALFLQKNNFHTQKLLVTKILYILSYSLLKDLNRFNKDVFILYILSYPLLKDLNRFNKEQATNSKISNFIVLQSHHFLRKTWNEVQNHK